MSTLTHVPTKLGKIAVEIETREGATPVIFLHGVYLDRHLWDTQAAAVRDRTVLTVDMPHHGESTDTPFGWRLDDCADMLLQILDHLKIDRVIAIGHSWGSMTIMRAVVRKPQQFAAVGLGNMPLEPGTRTKLLGYYLQSTMLPFRSFYAAQAAKVLFAPESLKAHPEFADSLKATMDRLSDREVRQVDIAVVIKPDNGFEVAKRLTAPALALRGEKDYVPEPPSIQTTTVPGGHISPLEAPRQVQDFVQRVIKLAEPA